MSNAVFFAWQSDTPSTDNKQFIWDALQKAAALCANETLLELSPRPEKDTDGLAGTPNIVATIFKRIQQCSMFLADVSFIATSANGKNIPNPNVMLELGFAVRSIGWERTLLVFNNAFGEQKDLPFDILQHRWPIEYRLTGETKVRENRLEKLTDAIEAALKDCETYSLIRAQEMAKSLDFHAMFFVAEHYDKQRISVTSGLSASGKPVRQLDLILHTMTIRHLFGIGALELSDEHGAHYSWTHDGRKMIEELRKSNNVMLASMIQTRSTTAITEGKAVT